MHSYDVATLHQFVVRVVKQLGSSDEEADLVAKQLVGSNLAGHDSHGVGILPQYVRGVLEGKLSINQEPEIVTDSGHLVVIDGQRGYGAAMGEAAMNVAIERAQLHGTSIVGLRNSYHIGRIGHWGEKVARAGLASIHFVNVIGQPPVVAPYGGSEPRFITNPICIAIPGGLDGEPLALLDMATSIIALGKARVALAAGEPVADGVLLDAEGRVTTDPSGMFEEPRQGAFVAFGDHKGSGLAIMCELLGAALLGGKTIQPEHETDWSIMNNMLTIVIDPNATGDATGFASEASALLDYVKTSKPREGFDEVLLPGEPEQRSRAQREHGIPIADATIQDLLQAAELSGLADAQTWLNPIEISPGKTTNR